MSKTIALEYDVGFGIKPANPPTIGIVIFDADMDTDVEVDTEDGS